MYFDVLFDFLMEALGTGHGPLNWLPNRLILFGSGMSALICLFLNCLLAILKIIYLPLLAGIGVSSKGLVMSELALRRAISPCDHLLWTLIRGLLEL